MKKAQQLTHFVYKVCSAVSAVAVVISLSSVAQAQSAFPERYRDVIDFRRAGVSDAMVEVACEHGDQQLVNTVFVQNRIKPQFIYNDDGTKSCLLPGGCSDKGETGQLPKRCESKRTDVKWFGDRDVRNDADAFVTSAKDKAAYSGIGKIECVGTKKVEDPVTKKFSLKRGTFYTTAFHVGSFDVMVTNAHTFVEDRINPITKEIEEVKLDPSNCSAVFFDLNGKPEKIPLAYVNSRWDKPGLFGDRSQDIAIVKLGKESTVPSTALPYQYGYGSEVVEKLSVTMVGFHNDVPDSKSIRKTNGVIFSASDNIGHIKEAAEKGLPFTNIKNLFVGNYPANHGSSGSPIFNNEGKVVGIQQGHLDGHFPNGESDREFNRQRNYNLGIFFDEQFHQDLQRMKAYKPSA